MDARVAGLLAGATGALSACAVAAFVPAAGDVGDAAVALSGVAAALVLWTIGGRQQRGLRGWRLLALTPLLPAAAAVVAVLAGPSDPLQLVVLRWLPTVPSYALAIAGLLTLVSGRRMRTPDARMTVEVALFLTACLVVDQMLVIGPDGSWSRLNVGAQLLLGAAVLVTSLTMAAALTLVEAVEARRQPMALVLLGGVGALAGGRAVQSSALLSGSDGALALSRFLVVTGLVLLVLALLLDVSGGRTEAGRRRRTSGRSTLVGQVLPHAAMVVATTTVGTATLLGHRPTAISFAGVVLCVVLTVVHRWCAARDDARMGARLRRSEAYFRSLLHDGGDAIVILDEALRITWISPALEAILDRPESDLVGRWLLELAHPDDAAEVTGTLGVAGGGRRMLTLRLADRAGRWRSLEAGVSDLRRHADVGGVVLHCRDVTERLARERALERTAYTDPLTGLPNRTAAVRALAQAIAAVPAGGPAEPGTALVVVEIDGAERVREQAGRAAAVAALAELARRLRATVREDDLVARLGDGHFAVLASGSPTEIDQLATRCVSVVEQPVVTAGGIVDLTASLGVVALTAGLDMEELLDRADMSVRAARASGPGSVRHYATTLREAAARRDRLREDLRDARARGELTLLFQPVVALEEHRVSGLEAQLRWRHAELGDVPPTEFLPIAEGAGLIGELQRWALEAATTAAAGLPDADPPVRIAVDICPGYVATGSLVTDVAAALGTSGLAADRLLLEIPESSLVAHAEQLAADVAALRLMGVHIAVENFGTGHTPLVQLTRVPIDVLKFDRSFVTRIDQDRQSRAMFESVFGIGRALGLDVVADGVETPAQLATLRGLGCGFAQGTLLSRPLPLAEVTTVLQEGAGLLWPGLIGEPA